MYPVVANSDMILNLPDNVIDQILSRLPIKDAVRTSVLSTNWRYKWTTITQLVFHDGMILPFPYNNMDKFIYFIDRVLLLHTGFIHKFELSSECLQSFSTIDCWILFLLRKNIKELVLKFSCWDDIVYKLPNCFFSAQQQISTLELHGCVVKPPPTFTGFSKLKSLCLYQTRFVDKDGFQCLISQCPLLERLTSMSVIDVYNLNICSPNLKYLCLYSVFQDICFENTPLLSHVFIHTKTFYISTEKLKCLQNETGNVVKVLSSLPNLKKFVVADFFLQFLTVGKTPEKLPFTCHHLNKLSLILNFEAVNELCVTLCLLNSSPNLRKLDIICRSFDRTVYHGKNFWEERTHIDWNMSGLQVVKITDFTGFELGLEFIKLLLANSPMLEMLSIRSDELDNCRKELKLLRELLVFPRASPKAKIKFLE